MRKGIALLIALSLALAACAGPARPASETAALPITGTQEIQASATSQPVDPAPESTPTSPASEAASPTAPVASATQAQVSPSGVVTYAIVPEESTVAYEVSETFLNQGNVINVAVGRAQGVTGEITVNLDQPQQSTVGTMTADISGFQSDSGRRDNAIRGRFLQSSQYPTVTFTPTAINGLPAAIEPGVSYPIQLTGDLTIREVTKPATFDANVQLDGDRLSGQATTNFLMSDFGFGPIEILGMLKTEDTVKITVDFVAQPK